MLTLLSKYHKLMTTNFRSMNMENPTKVRLTNSANITISNVLVVKTEPSGNTWHSLTFWKIRLKSSNLCVKNLIVERINLWNSSQFLTWLIIILLSRMEWKTTWKIPLIILIQILIIIRIRLYPCKMIKLYNWINSHLTRLAQSQKAMAHHQPRRRWNTMIMFTTSDLLVKCPESHAHTAAKKCWTNTP